MLEIQYTDYNFDTVTLVVSFSESKISCLIRIVSEAIINNSIFEFTVLTQP